MKPVTGMVISVMNSAPMTQWAAESPNSSPASMKASTAQTASVTRLTAA